MSQSPGKKLTQKRLKEVLNYNPNSKTLTWRINKGRIRKNSVAGSVTGDDYCLIRIDGVLYKAHRLVWLYVYGYFPETDIDHINRDKSDNRLVNLRVVSRQCNLRNRDKLSNNKSGVTGVNFCKKGDKWRPSIRVNGKLHSLGSFSNLSNAVKKRWEAEKKYNFPNCSTTSTAYSYLKDNGCLK